MSLMGFAVTGRQIARGQSFETSGGLVLTGRIFADRKDFVSHAIIIGKSKVLDYGVTFSFRYEREDSVQIDGCRVPVVVYASKLSRAAGVSAGRRAPIPAPGALDGEFRLFA